MHCSEFKVHPFDWKQALQQCQRSHWCGQCIFCRCCTSSLRIPLVQYLYNSQSSAERLQCLSGNYFKFLETLYPLSCLKTFTRILSSLVKSIFNFSQHQRCKHYFINWHKLTDWILPYWKLPFSSTNFKIFVSQKPLGKFCSEL